MYLCACGNEFEEFLGKYGCPDCCGENVAELQDQAAADSVNNPQ
jgi:hypothetical protein